MLHAAMRVRLGGFDECTLCRTMQACATCAALQPARPAMPWPLEHLDASCCSCAAQSVAHGSRLEPLRWLPCGCAGRQKALHSMHVSRLRPISPLLSTACFCNTMQVQHLCSVTALAFQPGSSGGSRLATGSLRGAIDMWEASKQAHLRYRRGEFSCLHASPSEVAIKARATGQTVVLKSGAGWRFERGSQLGGQLRRGWRQQEGREGRALFIRFLHRPGGCHMLTCLAACRHPACCPCCSTCAEPAEHLPGPLCGGAHTAQPAAGRPGDRRAERAGLAAAAAGRTRGKLSLWA